MEFTNSSCSTSTSTSDAKPEIRPLLFGIDLNEIPSSSSCETLAAVPDAFAVVRRFHDNPAPAPGPPASVPGEVRGSACSACGRPEVRGSVVVCDACERGFHLSCAGMRGRQAIMLEDWTCGECVKNGAGSKRWPLGGVCAGPKRSGVRLLDINALPPSDGEGEGNEELLSSRYGVLFLSRTVLVGSCGYVFSVCNSQRDKCSVARLGSTGTAEPRLITCSDILARLGFEDIVHDRLTMDRSFEADLSSVLNGRLKSSNGTVLRLPHRNQSEMCLQALRGFIFERHGILEEGWHVEFEQCVSRCEAFAVYCSPDGKRFESMFDVACHLGLVSNCNSIEPENRSDGFASVQKGLHLRRRRKESARLSRVDTENQETLRCGVGGELFSDVEIVGTRNSGNNVEVAEAGLEGGSGSQQLTDGLPVQYEDFFVLCLGQVDVRPSYHDTSQIWPVGYRSSWHDRTTGSLFMCNVSDGGDSGPIFKVRRYPCSALPIPNGSTVIQTPNLGRSDGQDKSQSDDSITFNSGYDEDNFIQMILSDPCPSLLENDLLSCFGSDSNEVFDVRSTNSLPPQSNCPLERSGKLLTSSSRPRDEIGEFLVEGRSSSLVWGMVSRALIDACRKVYKQRGTLQFFCEHDVDVMSSSYSDVADAKTKESLALLAKFCSSSCLVKIPRVIWSDNELETLCKALATWLDQDRFGLDMEFVQEFIEQLPGVRACSQYEVLNERGYCSASRTVGNGLLLAKRKSVVQGEEEDVLIGCKRARKQVVEDPALDDHCPPAGKPLSSKLPPELVGDVLQIWEFLWRFYEILGLKEPLSFEELEDELINPWFDGLNILENFKKDIREDRDISKHRSDGASGHTLSLSSESDSTVPGENPHAFIQMETVSMKEAAQARLASHTYSRCTGVALTKAHSSLLKVLVGELQSKVAALIDPNFDAGESKPRRGRKKDADNSIPAKKTKLDMLPINELTWPELARRYILTVSSTDGNLDSADITSRESGKVFRCLKGDGGVLCGSLTGVAGMEADALVRLTQAF
ncbi:hypothetical protein HHK36_015134 [Tetracentron sinense]|uniref:PHD-type domain-containing protein n=1 Tax=Tetracentron sinense TaxID=13715 RepID=A0A834Z1F8_TETSI|nr:hypothetical protein HHK36_015134 [Tetracentron sinense]